MKTSPARAARFKQGPNILDAESAAATTHAAREGNATLGAGSPVVAEHESGAVPGDDH